jgi:hypothetical protein
MIQAVMFEVWVALVVGLLFTGGASAQRGKSAAELRSCQAGVACCPSALAGFCRVGCPGSPPVPTRRFAPDLKNVSQPHPSGTAIIEVGVDEKGRAVSACVLRGVRPDFDQAAQAAALRLLWTPKVVKGRPVGFVSAITFATGDAERGK